MNYFGTEISGLDKSKIWDRIHVYKACLIQETLSGIGSCGDFRAAISAGSDNYLSKQLQEIGWAFFGVDTMSQELVEEIHQNYFNSPYRI
jgi:hypothetical protein